MLLTLYHRLETSKITCQAMTHSHWLEWDELQAVVLADHELQNTILALQSGSTSSPHFSLI